MKRQLAVPANLLLFGEYTILDDGGIGIGCATEPYMSAEISSASELIIESRMPQTTLIYRPFSKQASSDVTQSFLARLSNALIEILELAEKAQKQKSGVHIVVDSRPFFSKEGIKLGLGSSAALAVALSAALMIVYHGYDITDRETIMTVAVAAHRSAQGGGGSGYDIAASLYGGWGYFQGGLRPKWKSCQLPWIPHLALWFSNNAVLTPQAIRHYNLWCHRNFRTHQEYLQINEQAIRQLLRAKIWSEARPVAQQLADISAELGRQIGVPATIPPQLQHQLSQLSEREDYLCKALGAGDELFLIASSQPSSYGQTVTVATQGLHWQS